MKLIFIPLGIALYFTAHYEVTFWMIALLLLEDAAVVVRTAKDPDWYIARRVAFGLAPVWDLKGLIIGKIGNAAVLAVLGWHVGKLAHYI